MLSQITPISLHVTCNDINIINNTVMKLPLLNYLFVICVCVCVCVCVRVRLV